jgi:hypothetical protein
MFGIGKRGGGNVVAVADIDSGSAGVAIIAFGDSPKLLAFAREDLPLEKRSDDALESAIIQAFATAAEKAAKEYRGDGGPKRIAQCYCVLGSPWTHSYAGEAFSHFERETVVTDDMIGQLAKQSLADQKEIDPKQLLEAKVVRVLLNGYPTATPAGKRADEIRIFTLLSGWRSEIKTQLQEVLMRTFPETTVSWRSGARAILRAAGIHDAEQAVITMVSAEATDIIVVRKGILAERALIQNGIRQIASSFAEGKPVEETIALLDMLEKEQCETEACKSLEASIAKVEPELAKSFGETLAKLSISRKLPDQMVLIAPPQMSAWFSRFFGRIDFTQFTVSTRPFTVTLLSPATLPGLPDKDPRFAADPGLAIASSLVNMEMHS